MKYIAHRRFKAKAICGEVNIPACSELSTFKDVLFWNEKPVCFITSENAHQFFARNDDGQGLLRGKLTQAIQKTLEKRDKEHQKRWDKIWVDEKCQLYKRKEHCDFWLWNNEFFSAPIEDLKHIAELIGAKVGE